MSKKEYHHEESCCCGHEHHHDHEHHHEESCCCDHEHHLHEDIPFDPELEITDDGSEKIVFVLEGLDCVNCAAKIEAKIRQLPEVKSVSLTFATRQLRLSSEHPDQLQVKIQEIADSVEDGIKVLEKKQKRKQVQVEETVPVWKQPLFSIGTGLLLFIAGEFIINLMGISEQDFRMLPLFLIAYLILGGEVLLDAGKNIMKGQIFDENFLMCLATIGAFIIRMFPEAVGVMLFYRIGEYFEHRATEQSRSQIMEAVDLRPEVVNHVVGEEIRVIDAEDARVGDILLVRPGDRIPLDSVIVEGESRIDTSPVTGEPVPVMVKPGDAVISGCVNTSGQLKIRVEKALEESMVTKILDSVENAAASKPEIDKFITKFARVYTPFVVFFALAIAIILPIIFPGWHFWILDGDVSHSSLYTALTFLVISCPCALVLSVPLAFFAGIGAGSKKGILFKGGIVIEALKNVKAVVLDKTGTVTKGDFVVQEVYSVSDTISADEILALSASCELSSTHPIGNSIVEAARRKNLEIERPASVEEIVGHGICAQLEQGTVFCGNRKLMERYHIDLSRYHKDKFGTEVLVAFNGQWIGYIMIADTIKEDAKQSVEAVKKLGIMTVMLTGDAKENAEQVASETGIDEVHAKLLPEDKLSRLQDVRRQYGPVMFVGDGINDAPVLAGADIGAAMGSGADAAIEAADVVFMYSEMKAIPEALRIAKMTRNISWQNVVFALVVKVIVMILGLFGFANMWLAVFADTGVSVFCLINSIRILRQ
ncbi:MAG: heavy metal translocating P-type ATPase [Lachnospiraceae bacterium]|nr:heavy metal translocating P-type ATPase [Lachnospiraceae bacterium]